MAVQRAQRKRRTERGSYDHLDSLFYKLQKLDGRDPRRSDLRDYLVTEFMPVAEHIAHRYSGKGLPSDDLVQVAAVGLINAVDRFDPQRASDFLSFAVPTIMGEVRRHFRDCSWAMRVPRRVQELHQLINRADNELAQELSRPASSGELAEHLDVPKSEVQEGFAARNAYRAESLDESLVYGGDGDSRAERIGGEDKALEQIDNHESLMPLLNDLAPRERYVLEMRYAKEMTQSQIADEIGVSQMQVSRMLNRTLTNLRENLIGAEND